MASNKLIVAVVTAGCALSVGSFPISSSSDPRFASALTLEREYGLAQLLTMSLFMLALWDFSPRRYCGSPRCIDLVLTRVMSGRCRRIAAKSRIRRPVTHHRAAGDAAQGAALGHPAPARGTPAARSPLDTVRARRLVRAHRLWTVKVRRGPWHVDQRCTHSQDVSSVLSECGDCTVTVQLRCRHCAVTMQSLYSHHPACTHVGTHAYIHAYTNICTQASGQGCRLLWCGVHGQGRVRESHRAPHLRAGVAPERPARPRVLHMHYLWAERSFFFSISRSMPTANAEDPLFRSEGRPKDAPPPRPFRCYPPTRSSPRAFAVGTRRKVAKNRSTLRPCTPDIAPKVCSERLQGSKWARCVLCMRGCMCVAYMLLVRCTHVVHMLHPCCASVAGMLRVCCRYVARVLLAFCIHVCCRYVAGHAYCMHVVYTLQACMLRACCIYVASMLGAAAPAETSTMPRVATRCARRIQRARRGYMPSLICHN